MEENKKVVIDESKFDNKTEDYDESKILQGIGLSFCMWFFASIYGIKKYPKKSKARRTFIIANIVTSIAITIIILGVLMGYVFINLIGDIAQGTTEAIIDGAINQSRFLI